MDLRSSVEFRRAQTSLGLQPDAGAQVVRGNLQAVASNESDAVRSLFAQGLLRELDAMEPSQRAAIFQPPSLGGELAEAARPGSSNRSGTLGYVEIPLQTGPKNQLRTEDVARMQQVDRVREYDRHSSKAAIERSHGGFTITSPSGKTYEQPLLRVPSGVDVHVIDREMLVLVNTEGSHTGGGQGGVGGALEAAFGGGASTDAVLVIRPSPYQFQGEERLDFRWDRFSGTSVTGSGGDNIQSIVDDFAHGLYRAEFDARSTTLKSGDQPLNVRGPNRDGEYELTSGRSSLLLSPNGDMRPGAGWDDAVIRQIDLARGRILVDNTYGGQTTRYQVQLEFGNSNPRRSYTASIVEPN